MTIIKCLIVTNEPNVYKRGMKYTGILYDVWQKIKSSLPEYTFNEEFISTSNYENIVDKINTGEYDIAIGGFSTTSIRLKKVLFTQPIYLNKDVILYYPKNNMFKNIISLFFTYFLPIFSILIIIALFIGFIFKRNIKDIKNPYTESILSIFGRNQRGMFDFTSTDKTTLILSWVLFIISLFSIQMLQAYIINGLNKKLEEQITIENIQFMTFLCPAGFANGDLIEKYRCKVVRMDKNIDEIIEVYKNNMDKYDGVVYTFIDSMFLLKRFKGLSVTTGDFGFDGESFIVNRSHIQLCDKINIIIEEMSNSLDISDICQIYLGEKNKFMCII